MACGAASTRLSGRVPRAHAPKDPQSCRSLSCSSPKNSLPPRSTLWGRTSTSARSTAPTAPVAAGRARRTRARCSCAPRPRSTPRRSPRLPQLKVVARAGVGLDNVDIKSATTAGVMVVNAPTSNIISAAELTIGHILSLARHIPNAHASLAGGQWKRSAYTGTELFEKTVGIVGPRPHRCADRGASARLRRARRRIRPLRDAHARAAAAGRAALVRRRAAPERLRHRAHAQDARDHRHDRRRAARAHEADRFRDQCRAWRTRSTKRRCTPPSPPGVIAGAGLDVFTSEPPVADSSASRLLGPAERRRHAAPRREHRRGAGEGRRVGRALGQARARGRPRSGCRERRGRDHRSLRASGHRPRREAGPVLHGPRARRGHEPRHRGARRAGRLRRQRLPARGAQGHSDERRERERVRT